MYVWRHSHMHSLTHTHTREEGQQLKSKGFWKKKKKSRGQKKKKKCKTRDTSRYKKKSGMHNTHCGVLVKWIPFMPTRKNAVTRNLLFLVVLLHQCFTCVLLGSYGVQPLIQKYVHVPALEKLGHRRRSSVLLGVLFRRL